ncbi:hypothetical protein SOCEGT47_070960 [Sorangium cellulosum]|uniref:Uncharacterized protein n=1 Tax=Sorangium cellulosum TaxID=56 RepID=A0A4P2QB54_SORCE|nr:hypothetical protein [Sorangium cellulosum]AUX26526.1 hypothetical protein SOCEGT47_070960 [Sorangium cellulosum]
MSGADDPRRRGQAEEPTASGVEGGSSGVESGSSGVESGSSGVESGSRPTPTMSRQRDDAAPPHAVPDDRPAAPPRSGDLPEDGDLPLVDELDLRELLRDAMRPPPAAPPSLLRGVQRRIRVRSRGKFYGDGWSTARSPRSTYLMTSLFMLCLIAFVFLVLVPWSTGALP